VFGSDDVDWLLRALPAVEFGCALEPEVLLDDGEAAFLSTLLDEPCPDVEPFFDAELADPAEFDESEDCALLLFFEFMSEPAELWPVVLRSFLRSLAVERSLCVIPELAPELLSWCSI